MMKVICFAKEKRFV
jgi:hypothetical protein